MFEIETEAGTVYAVSEGLAAAIADLVATEQRRTESDLVEAVRMPLIDEFRSPARVLVA